jgi:hypothetical protein
MPGAVRARAALRTARLLVRSTYPGSRAITRRRREVVEIDLRGSLFCEVREASARPLCGFYVAAIGRVLELFSVGGEAQVVQCRAAGTQRGCTLTVATLPRPGSEIERPEHAA